MCAYQEFDLLFNFDTGCTYQNETIKKIESNRDALHELFIEKVLKLLGMKRPSKFYPPKTNKDLRNLHKAVVESRAPEHHKLSVIYYILLEFDDLTQKNIHSTVFEGKQFLPRMYQILMKGLFHMDRQQFEIALQYLTHPSLIPSFAEDIIDVLVRASDKDFKLPLAYYQSVQPTLTDQRALESLFLALAQTSVTEAFFFSRGQPENTKRYMFEKLISHVLNDSTSDTIDDRSIELLNLPLTKGENLWLEEYLLNGEGRGLKNGKDTLMMRRIGTGRFTESLCLKGIQNHAIDGLDWTKISGAIQEGLGPRLDL